MLSLETSSPGSRNLAKFFKRPTEISHRFTKRLVLLQKLTRSLGGPGHGRAGAAQATKSGAFDPLEAPQTPKTGRKVAFSTEIRGVAPWDGPRRRWVPGFCQAGAPDSPWGYPPRPPKNQSDPNGEGFGVHLYCLTARGQWRGWVTTVLVYREALPSLTVLTGRSAGGLGRSLERPCKWSAALSAV